ncbi:hypothetical protein [Lactococcus lactis]|uniref:Uncharacterized protein n=1 Tax=Lactococcus lactis TaxID=1358 RepID=A0AAW8U924_9LACT|nr:hypothetical protein [Lactococcus lactis]MDT2880296.1 hypothetical protein [Lactococcus lactis]MDT2945344.1 hypothetical protein [Lactococcus lactis]MDT2947509.1 hypothetical protein [Lactococcus lactis]
MEQPDFSHRVKKIEDPEEKRLAIVKATQSIEKKFGSNTILNRRRKSSSTCAGFSFWDFVS